MKKLIGVAIGMLLFASSSYSQGCIVVRNISGYGQYNLTDNSFSNAPWQLNVTARTFKAYRDYRLKKDLHTPKANQNVIKSFSTDFSLSRYFNKGWSMVLSLPISSNSRTTVLEHGGTNTPRYTTRTFGLGDIRLTAYKWLLKPSAKQKGNIQVGLGLKLPTGDYKAQDYFHWNDSTVVLGYANPSIQLGDGGTGIITELNTYYAFNMSFSVYGNFYYMMNPREQNGVPTSLGGRPVPDILKKVGAAEVTVPDIWSWRVGANYNLMRWAFSLGLRDDGSPVKDLLGGDLGSRRPGYTLQVEPGIMYRTKGASIYLYVPIEVSHEIKQNITDKKITELTGVYTVGLGGSGDYQVFLGVQFKL